MAPRLKLVHLTISGLRTKIKMFILYSTKHIIAYILIMLFHF
jgi:hypothetical protein